MDAIDVKRIIRPWPDVHEADGELDASIDIAHRLLEQEQTAEAVHRRLMRLYASTAQRSRALQQYDRCAAILHEELGVEPDQETLTLHEQVRSGYFAEQHSAAAATHRTTVTPATLANSITPSANPYLQSIAIMPLDNTASKPAVDYLCEGIAENLIYHVSRLSSCRIMAWSTVLRYHGSAATPADIGRELGVDSVLMGRVSSQPDGLDVALELVATVDGSLIWGDHYTGKLTQVLAMQTQVARDVLQQLSELTQHDEADELATASALSHGKRVTPSETTNENAYHEYLKGRYHWNKPVTAQAT